LAAPVPVERLEAAVNANLILLSDIQEFRKGVVLRSQLDPLFAGTPIASRGKDATQAEIVQFLIDERLILQQFPVTDSEVEQEINSIQNNNRIDRATLKTALKQQGFSFDQYFELIRVSTAKRNLIDRDIRTKVNISDDDVKNYFYNNVAKTSAGPRAYHVKIITVSPQTFKTAAAARSAANSALKAIRGGERFEEVAKRASDSASASNGGDLGVVTEDQMAPAVSKELKKLKIGQVSDVLGSPDSGLFILYLADVKSGETDRLEKMKDEIRGQLAAAEYQHQISLWLERNRQQAFIHRAGVPLLSEISASSSP
jgi:peptidyl-prolyl cis-trans isomerase SurA